MRILVHSGFFIKEKLSKNAKEEQDGYLLTPASRLLLKDEPLSVTPFLLAMLDPILTKLWHRVSEWFQNGDPTPFDTAHGRTLWEYGRHEPRLNHFLNEAMASDARLVTKVLVKDCKGVFEGLHSLVDVGGSTGTVAKAIADAFPNLKCTVLDHHMWFLACKGLTS
ncbi:probable O-methyltransferase 3 [Camellia sinensis]|uniref:probable O-methyltransferase 3 n=1 Tax=Camellia sinensis TaxID=4442 RepID=UPI001036501A|nr:probable O-methyltransferase 3 [Camellia sinensis]